MSHALIEAVSMPTYGVRALRSTARDTGPETSSPNEPWTANAHSRRSRLRLKASERRRTMQPQFFDDSRVKAMLKASDSLSGGALYFALCRAALFLSEPKLIYQALSAANDFLFPRRLYLDFCRHSEIPLPWWHFLTIEAVEGQEYNRDVEYCFTCCWTATRSLAYHGFNFC